MAEEQTQIKENQEQKVPKDTQDAPKQEEAPAEAPVESLVEEKKEESAEAKAEEAPEEGAKAETAETKSEAKPEEKTEAKAKEKTEEKSPAEAKKEKKVSKKGKEDKVKTVLDRVYTIPLKSTVPRTRKTPNAMRYVKLFVKKHAKTENVHISPELNQAVWARGMQKPPQSVRVQIKKDETGRAEVTLKQG